MCFVRIGWEDGGCEDGPGVPGGASGSKRGMERSRRTFRNQETADTDPGGEPSSAAGNSSDRGDHRNSHLYGRSTSDSRAAESTPGGREKPP